MADNLKGLDFPIRFGPLGHLERAQGESKINANLRNIVMTTVGERLTAPGFGITGYAAIFRNLDIITQSTIRELTREAITKHEPRVRVLNVKTSPSNEDTLAVTVSYEVRRSGEFHDFDVLLEG